MWRAAGREGKFAGRGGRAHEDGAGGEDDGAAIEEFADVDALAGIGAAGRTARDLQDARPLPALRGATPCGSS